MSRTLAWVLAACAAALVSIGAAAILGRSSLPPEALKSAQYVGSATCAECHRGEFDEWHGSHHDRAMEIATEETVLGDFNDAAFERLGVTTRFFRRDGKFFVNAEGPDGQHHDYEVKWTFGIEPLQQYMVELERGRVQVLRVSWDTDKKQWFEVPPPDAVDERLAPNDPLHWTGVAQNWNTTCAECHSTNLQKNYDLETDTYRTTFDEIDVSCEECHGPGSVHVELADRWLPGWDRNIGYGLANLKSEDPTVQIDTCAKCHSRRHVIHADFRPGEPFLDYFEPSLLSDDLYHHNGQIKDEVYEYGSFLQSKMHAQRVRCTDCHNPHSLALKYEGNRLCTQCHLPNKYDTPDHHHHPVGSAGASCIECHMPMRTYMVNDNRRDHSFRVPRPDLTFVLGTPNTCNDCHTKPEETPLWAAERIREWYGDERRDDPHWTPAIVAGNEGKPGGDVLLADVIERPTTPAIVRATAVGLIAQYGSQRSIAAQYKALRDADPLVRMAAVRALSGGPSPEEVVRLLGEKLSDPVRAVRLAAVQRLVPVGRDQLPTQHREPFDRALAEYRGSQQLTSERAHPHINLGWLERQLGNLPESAKQFRTAIRMEPYLAGPRSELANMLASGSGDAEEIRKLRGEEATLLERDAALVPDGSDIYYRLGLLRFQLGELDAAAAALEQACELAPVNYEYRMALALLNERRYEQSGDAERYNAAIASLRKLHAQDPNDPRAQQILERLVETRRIREAGADPATSSDAAP